MSSQIASITTLDYVNECIDNDLVHEIHTSERRSFRGCRRRWDWIYRENFYPKITAKPLEFGVAFHVGLETYYNPATWHFDNEIKVQRSLQAFVDECEKQRKAALQGQTELDVSIQADYDERVELGRGMISHYLGKVAPREDANWTPVKVEVEFQVAIPHPDTGDFMFCKCMKCWYKYIVTTDDYNTMKSHPSGDKLWPLWYWEQKKANWIGLPVTYGGRLDLLAQDEFGHYWIFDHKSASTLQDKNWLDLDDQIGSYVWALRKLGLDVKGFVYNEILKNYPSEPKALTRPSGGRMYSVAKNQGTDYETFLRTVTRKDTSAWSDGLYDEYLTYLQNEGMRFYDRRVVDKTTAQCEEIERTIGEEALDMINENLRTYPSPNRFNCNYCAFRQPCLEKNNRGDYQYALDTMFEKREHYYLTARKQSTDKELV